MKGRVLYEQQDLNQQGALEKDQDYERRSTAWWIASGQAQVMRRTSGVA